MFQLTLENGHVISLSIPVLLFLFANGAHMFYADLQVEHQALTPTVGISSGASEVGISLLQQLKSIKRSSSSWQRVARGSAGENGCSGNSPKQGMVKNLGQCQDFCAAYQFLQYHASSYCGCYSACSLTRPARTYQSVADVYQNRAGTEQFSTDECQSSQAQPYSLEACKVAAQQAGLKLGGQGYQFSGNFGTKGCYTYSNGKYKGYAYYGMGGTMAQRKASLKSPKMRVQGHDQCGGGGNNDDNEGDDDNEGEDKGGEALCKPWCNAQEHASTPWTKKCAWKSCNGCTECTAVTGSSTTVTTSASPNDNDETDEEEGEEDEENEEVEDEDVDEDAEEEEEEEDAADAGDAEDGGEEKGNRLQGFQDWLDGEKKKKGGNKFQEFLKTIKADTHPEIEIPKEAQVTKTVNRIIALIHKEAAVLGGDYSRIYLGGWSQGATVALLTAIHKDCPSLGGLLSITGTLHVPRVEAALQQPVKTTPFRLYAGVKDDTYPLMKLKPMIEKLRAVGYNIELREKDMGHNLNGRVGGKASDIEERWMGHYIDDIFQESTIGSLLKTPSAPVTLDEKDYEAAVKVAYGLLFDKKTPHRRKAEIMKHSITEDPVAEIHRRVGGLSAEELALVAKLLGAASCSRWELGCFLATPTATGIARIRAAVA